MTSQERWQSPVDRARLEIVYTFGYRGFESPPLRQAFSPEAENVTLLLTVEIRLTALTS